MKKYLFLSMAAIAALFTFASCGDDDEIEPDDINPEDVKVDNTEYTYSKEAYAKQSYEDAMANKDEDDLTVYSYKGKVYKEDETAYYKGQSKDEIREYLKFLEGSIK